MFTVIVATLMCGASLPGAEAYLAGHESERAGRYAEAVQAYASCVQQGGPLAAYARVKAVFCRGASGDSDGAIEAYRTLLKGPADGPWARMAHAYLAGALAARKMYEEAAREYAEALDFQPKPWWVQSYDRTAAGTFIECPALRGKGYDFYRGIIDTTRLRTPRLEASEQLALSPVPADLLAGARGYIKTGEYGPALPLLLKTAPAPADWMAWIARLGTKQKPPSETDLACMDALPEGSANGDWIRTWLYYTARSQAAADNMNASAAACQRLAKIAPKADETGDAIWILAGRLAKAEQKAQAIEWYRRLDTTNAEHTRADDALFAAMELQRDKTNIRPYADACGYLAERHPDSSLLAKAWYSVAIAYEKAGKSGAAREAFVNAAKQGPGDFYAHRALERLQGMGGKDIPAGRAVPVAAEAPLLRAMAVPADPLPQYTPLVADSPRFRRIAFFAEHGLEEAEWEALALLPLLGQDPAAPALYALLGETGIAYTAMNIAEAYKWGEHEGVKSDARRRIQYPRAYWNHVQEIAKNDGIDPYLILAVARQESTFRPALSSFAGAAGVMQLMPATARLLAKSEADLGAAGTDNLEDPVYSLRLGSRYLKRMLQQRDGNVAYALASYNAGPGNCSKWRKRFGDVSLESFIESIPFDETRDYVKTVLANYAAYLSLYDAG